MKTLEEILEKHRQAWGAVTCPPSGHWCPTDVAFYLGATAMAEQFAQGQGTVLLLLRDLAEIMTRNSQLLAHEIRELRKSQEDRAQGPT